VRQPQPHLWQTRTTENIGCNSGASNIDKTNAIDTIWNASLKNFPTATGNKIPKLVNLGGWQSETYH